MQPPTQADRCAQAATQLNEVWSMDFVSDQLASGLCLKSLTVADDFSYEAVQIAVDFSMSGQYVTRMLEQAAQFRGYPAAIRIDNGPEFTSRAFMGWAQMHGIQHILTQPGRQMQNGYFESFNARFRDEYPNEHIFDSLAEARQIVAVWRDDCNQVRAHGSISRILPAVFVARCRQERAATQRSTSSQPCKPRTSFLIAGMASGGRPDSLLCDWGALPHGVFMH